MEIIKKTRIREIINVQKDIIQEIEERRLGDMATLKKCIMKG